MQSGICKNRVYRASVLSSRISPPTTTATLHAPFQLIELAKEAGADAAKFQNFSAAAHRQPQGL